MSPEHSTFAPSLLDDSVKEDPCKDLGAASLARPFTKKQQYEFNNVEESRGYEFRDRRQAMDLVKWVNVRVDNQKKLVGKSDMSKYLVYEQETKTMTQEAQECYDPKFKYGTLAEAMVGEQGTENSFRISTRMGTCREIQRRGHIALEQLTRFKTLAKDWEKPWNDENNESILYWEHLTAQKKEWAAAEALESAAGRVAQGNFELVTKESQDRGSSQPTRKSSQDSLTERPVKYKQTPPRPEQDPQISCYTSQCESQQAICNNNLYISECKQQSEATANENNKHNYDKTAECLTEYNKELERLYFSKEPADEDGSLMDLRKETAIKYSRWVRTAGVPCPSIRDQLESKIQVQDDCPSDSRL